MLICMLNACKSACSVHASHLLCASLHVQCMQVICCCVGLVVPCALDFKCRLELTTIIDVPESLDIM